MIRHIVLLRFRPDMTEAAIAGLFTELHRIEGKIPGLLAITSGKSESPEQMERGYMHGFVVDFADWAALQAYQDHPDHKALGAGLVRAAEGGIDGILVFDLPVTTAQSA
ncbi:MAG: hypothetical protein RLZZ437_2207 [Pseudomonadota bacterium]|jgi:Stress responsive A/B Barrel Domain